MKSKIVQSMLVGIISTAIMTAFVFLDYGIGFPKMNPAEMLASTMGTPLLVGYAAHFMIGIIFATGYVYLFNPKIRINNKWVKGLLFGFTVFVIARVMMFIMGTMIAMPMPSGGKMMLMAGSLILHLVFGVAVAVLVRPYKIAHSAGFFGNIPA